MAYLIGRNRTPRTMASPTTMCADRRLIRAECVRDRVRVYACVCDAQRLLGVAQSLFLLLLLLRLITAGNYASTVCTHSRTTRLFRNAMSEWKNAEKCAMRTPPRSEEKRPKRTDLKPIPVEKIEKTNSPLQSRCDLCRADGGNVCTVAIRRRRVTDHADRTPK